MEANPKPQIQPEMRPGPLNVSPSVTLYYHKWGANWGEHYFI